MTIQLSSLRNATFAIVAGTLAIAACSSSTDGGPATSGTDSGATAEAGAMDDGSTGSDSGTAADTGSTDSAMQMDTGGLKPFGATCGGNSECASGACFMGGMGSYCSLHCTAATAATDCPVPPTSGQCNGMMFCKKP